MLAELLMDGEVPMTPRTAKKQFLKQLKQGGHSLKTLTPAAGVEAMCQFYATERAAGCDIDDDGDMLLFQWGTFDWGKGDTLEINITRQFIANGGDPTQLALTFRFAVCGSSIKSGSKWCESLSDLAKLQRFINKARVMQTLQQQLPTEVELRYGAT